MTLIKKLILKFKKLFLNKSSAVKQEKVLVNNEKEQEKPTEFLDVYYSKSRQDALKFQDECNTELWWKDNG